MRAWVACVLMSGALAACASRRHITWEDVGAPSKSEDARAPARADTSSDKQGAPRSEPPRLDAGRGDFPASTSAGPALDPPLAAAPTPTAPSPAEQRAVAPTEGIDLTPRGAVALPGIAARVEDGALVDVDALTLVCIADARALTDTTAVFRRLEEEADRIGAKLGGVRLIRFVRDPARSLSDPPPRACRTLIGESALKAPLSREQEHRSTWLVTASTGSIVDDAARAAARASADAHKVTLPPRAVVDDAGVITAVAIPVEPKTGGG